jgi:hypothetical protein
MLTLTASACQDLPTDGDNSPAPGRRPASNRSTPDGPSPYTCNISTRDPDGPYPFVYKHVVVDFPKPALAENGETVLLRYAWTDPDGRPIAGANCRVPRTEMAVDLMDRRLGVQGKRHLLATHRKREDGMASTMSDPVCYTYACPLPGLIVTPGPTYYNAPQPYDPYSKDPCWANCANGASQGTNDGNGYGWDPGTPSCDPNYDPNCYVVLTDADKKVLGDDINDYLRPQDQFTDEASRQRCEQLFTKWQEMYTGGRVFRGATTTKDSDPGVDPHWGAYDSDADRIHFDPVYLDRAATGDAKTLQEMMNTALHEAAHALGYDHTEPVPTLWGVPAYAEDYYSQLSPGSNSCITWSMFG